MKKFLLIILMITPFLGTYAEPQQVDCLEDSYSEAIGVREATGQNDGFEVEKYLASTGLSKGYAWCAAFVTYYHLECGFEVPKAPAWSPSWFTRNVIYHRGEITYRHANYSQPRSGDVFGIYFSNKNRVAHVGFVDDWIPDKKYVVTVEGNTNKAGSREGDGVYRKYRLKSQVYQIARWTRDYGTS